MKKLLLVNTNTEKFPYPIPPLGLCLLASSLEKEYEVKISDATFDEGASLVPMIELFNPDYIGVGIRNVDDVVAENEIFYPDDILSRFIHPLREKTDVPLIIGGSGFSIFPSELMEFSGADYGIEGEGEHTFHLLLQELDSKRPVKSIPGVWVKGRGKPTASHFFPRKRYPAVPWSEIDRWIDFEPYRQRGVYSIQTKRGCNMRCIYCTYPGLEGKSYRLRPPDEIAREIMEAMDRLGMVTFDFVDSTFNEPKGHAEAICRAIIDHGIRPRLRTMGINPRNTSYELFDLMIKAGFVQVDVTPDSASPKVVRNLRKGFTTEDIRRTANLIREFDLPTMWFFLFGGPGEDETTFDETMRFVEEYINQKDMVYMLSGLRIYPGTQLEISALKKGIILPGQSLFYPSHYYYSEQMGQERIRERLLEAERKLSNCIPAFESTPDPEMLEEAIRIRKAENLTEPMFRTLMRLRNTHPLPLSTSREGRRSG